MSGLLFKNTSKMIGPYTIDTSLSDKLEKDSAQRIEIEGIAKALSNVKGCTFGLFDMKLEGKLEYGNTAAK